MQIKAMGMSGNDVTWVGLLNFELRGKDEAYFRLKLTETNLVLSVHDGAEEELENLYAWSDSIQWYRSWGKFNHKTMKFVILSS